MKPVRLVQYIVVLMPAPNSNGNDLELALLVTKSLAQLTPSTSEAKVAHESPDGNILAPQSTCHSPDEQVPMGSRTIITGKASQVSTHEHEHAVVLGMGLKEA